MARTPSPSKIPKKVNLNDPHAIKHLLDETVTEIVTSQGYAEDVRLSNIKLLIGVIIITIALAAQFYPKKFPANRDFLIVCIILYVIFNGLLQLIIYTKDNSAILFTYPPPLFVSPIYPVSFVIFWLVGSINMLGKIGTQAVADGSFNSTGLVVSSKLPRFSDIYTLTVASSDPKSVSAHPSVQLAKSTTEWFTRDGVLVEGYFWKDVMDLVNGYAKDGRKTK